MEEVSEVSVDLAAAPAAAVEAAPVLDSSTALGVAPSATEEVPPVSQQGNLPAVVPVGPAELPFAPGGMTLAPGFFSMPEKVKPVFLDKEDGENLHPVATLFRRFLCGRHKKTLPTVCTWTTRPALWPCFCSSARPAPSPATKRALGVPV